MAGAFEDRDPLLVSDAGVPQMPVEPGQRGMIAPLLKTPDGAFRLAVPDLLGGAGTERFFSNFARKGTYDTRPEAMGQMARDTFDAMVLGGPGAIGAGAVAKAAGLVPRNALTSGGGSVMKAAPGALDMSPAAREARARAMGAPETPFYHGTTHDIDLRRGFSDPSDFHSPYEADSHHGRAIYMSSDYGDSSDNYAGVGPDLTNRIERYVEQVDPSDMSRDEKAAALRAYRQASKDGALPSNMGGFGYSDRDQAAAYGSVIQNMYGGSPQTLPLRPTLKNPVALGAFEDYRPTYFERKRYGVEQAMDKDGNPIDDDWIIRDPDGNEYDRAVSEGDAYEIADELTYNNQDDQFSKMLDVLRGYSQDAAMAVEEGGLDGISAQQLEDLIRNGDFYFEDDNYNMISPGQILQEMYRAAGHDAVIMPDADQVFPGMNMGGGTTHIAVFDPSSVRHADAAFDPTKANSRDLLAAGAFGVPVGAFGVPREQPIQDPDREIY